MYYSSYYDRIGKKAKTNKNYNKFNTLESIISHHKLTRKIKNIIIKRYNEEELEPEYLFLKLKEDMPKHEKYIQDPKYRKEFEEEDSGIGYTFYQNYELIYILGLEKNLIFYLSSSTFNIRNKILQ